MVNQSFKIILEQDEDGVFVASVPAVPGCFAEGKTYEKVMENIEEALSLCLDIANEDKDYHAKIDWSDGNKSKFFGVVNLNMPMLAC